MERLTKAMDKYLSEAISEQDKKKKATGSGRSKEQK